MNSKFDALKEILFLQKKGIPKGIYSVCSSNRYVIEASLKQAQKEEGFALIESTSNQVNQYGGYMGMTPGDFKYHVYGIAEELGFPIEKIILGGDHLGPNPFQNDNIGSALEKARSMVKHYLQAGFTKIHLDTSMPLRGDPGKNEGELAPDIAAERCAELCVVAEETYGSMKSKNNQIEPPLYVIGTEVPAPGGSDEVEDGVKVTSVSDFQETVSITEEAFYRHKLYDAWERVIAVVVQPGVEYGDHTVIDYDRGKASALSEAIREFDSLIFEAHSTDYQTVSKLREMVEDGFAILKVGPALTFAMREAVFSLCAMEKDLSSVEGFKDLSNLIEVIDGVMKKKPVHWDRYYTGNNNRKAYARRYSYFDRIRYYWSDESIEQSLNVLIQNFKKVSIPLSLISQFFPGQYRKIRNGELKIDPVELIRDRIMDVLTDFSCAVGKL